MKLNHRWTVVLMLWMVCFLSYADRQVIFVLFPLLRSDFHLSSLQLGMLSASFMVMYAVTGPVAGWVTDRVSRRNVILGALLFWSATTALSSLSHRFGTLLATVAMAGVGEAFYFPAAMSLISDYHASATRSRAMSLHQSGVYVGSIVGGWLAGWIGQHVGWRAGFRDFGVAGIVLSIVLLGVLREPPRAFCEGAETRTAERASLWQGALALARHPVARLLVVVFIGANFVAMVFTVWMPTYLFSRFHLSLSLAGLSGTAYMQLASVLGVLAGGIAADRTVRRSGHAGGRLRVMACGLLFALPAIAVSGWTARIAVLLCGMVAFGLGKGVYESSLWSSLYDVVPASRRGTSLGLMNSLGWLGGAAAQMIIGAASSRYGLGICFSATAVIYLAIALTLLHGATLLQREGSSQTSAT